MIEILQGDCVEVLRTLPDRSVQMCVTSPPYWGLRDYGVDGQIGLESSVDAYIAKMVEVFSEVRRVLRDDGVLWLNLGDSFCNTGKWGGGKPEDKNKGANDGLHRRKKLQGLKPKDLIGIPWRVAFALQADGWYLRADCIWHKPNAFPESVKDRPTKSHEYIFLLTKNQRYYYDHEAIKEPASPDTHLRYAHGRGKNHKYSDGGPGNQTLARSTAHMIPGVNPKASTNERGSKQNSSWSAAVKDVVATRNKRTVWSVPSRGFSEAHFATFPPKLIEPCILAGSKPGDVVLDPFFGAGTTGMVALEHGRECIGIELNPGYIEIAKRRLDKIPHTPLKIPTIAA